MTTLLRRLTATRRGGGLRGPPAAWICRRCVATQARTYDDALQLLGTLQTNAAAKQLFGNRRPRTSVHQSASRTNYPARRPPSPHDAAIPEMLAWLSRAGIDPEALPLRAIHIAGSKGKGSTAAYASAILRAALGGGRRVGTYTSPHLVSVRERIALDGAPISRELFAKYFFEVWDAVGCPPERDPGGGGPPGEDGLVRPFFFRFMTILALHAFVREGVRDVVLECGIGGEYDATNVLPARCVSAAVLTHVAREHLDMLGPTKEDVAWHKAGIFRRGAPAFMRPQESSVMAVCRARAREAGARLVKVGDLEAERWAVEGAGPFDAKNRALAAAAALHHLHGARHPTDEEAEWMAMAMRDARPRGRWEVLREGPTTFFLDGAHTPASVASTAAWFAARSDPRRKRVLVFNQQERDAVGLLTALVEGFGPEAFNEAVFTRNELEDVPGEGELRVQRKLAKRMRKLAPDTFACSRRGLRGSLRGIRGQEADVLVTGSMHLVGAVLKVLEGEE